MTEIPRMLGDRYEIGDLIGRGGMAQVHLGYDTRLSRTVAVKILRSDLAADPTFLARFRREAQSAAALNHPAIVAVYDTGEEKIKTSAGRTVSLPYIVMEYVRGRTVAKLLSGGNALPINEAVQIIVGVLSALEYSHREGIIHRDIKPGNIMLSQDGKVKVMDFGIARAVADSAATMTSTNSVVGTAQYLSPEQARGEVVDARSDLYSTGCLLYELLTGRPPFQGDSAVAVAYQHVSETPKPASSIAKDIPNTIDRIVMKSLAKRREDRYQSAAEMRADLLAASRGGEVDAPQIKMWQTSVLPTPPRPAEATQITPTVPTEIYSPMSEPNPTNGTDTGFTPVTPPGRKKKALIWLVAVLAVLAVAGIGFAIHSAMTDTQDAPAVTLVKVPDLKGMNQVQARQALEKAKLKFRLGESVEDDSVPAGSFVSSDPKVGAEVKPGSEVTVHFSSGAKNVNMPDLVSGNKTLEEAKRELKEAGLTVGNIEQEDKPGLGKNIVFETEPAAGSPVAKGSSVTLYVSTGQVDLPNLVNGSLESAQNELNARKLVFNMKTVENDAAKGTVISQNPLAGKVRSDQRIELVVSSGPAPKPVPPQQNKPDQQTNSPADNGSGDPNRKPNTN
ncbi:Stk1 family PASTA domain-containing Ser/Thr kinase [Arcanobacterium sp. S3PF19]|uniref:Stk1 family PASTA domain-containing Ser/Thr kinase n=1 Tax=Arcanobacterium sp. S3PF19 TaxID=1219585 RepID=UPI0009FE705E|nr:Stk1 family PASTA domain-containing Ser/Thr kinase [Arcanobacterium sp. S3PF19]